MPKRTGPFACYPRDLHERQEASELQLLQQMQRLLWLLALLARADGRAVGDHGGQEASEQHLLQ